MEPIKMVGSHKATVSLGEDIKAEITVVVDKAE